jgi:hypothetical protein
VLDEPSGQAQLRQVRTNYDTEPYRARRGNVNSGEMVEVNVTDVDATAILLWSRRQAACRTSVCDTQPAI